MVCTDGVWHKPDKGALEGTALASIFSTDNIKLSLFIHLSFKISSSIKEENKNFLPKAARLIFPLGSKTSFFQTVSNTYILSRPKGKFFLPTGIHS